VAHTSVKDPERVIIRNAGNGKSVVGALFRRERELPGPGLQVSSDAAEALGLLAGQPGELSVVALRREEAPVPPDAEIGAEDEIATEAAPAEAAPTETVAAETVAAETVAAETVAADTATAEAAEAAAEAAGPAPDAGGLAADAPAAKPRGLFGFLKKKPKPEPAEIATDAGAGAIEQTALDPVAASAAAAIDRAETTAAAPASAAAPAAAPDAAPAAAPDAAPAAAPDAAAALKRGYIQIGIFSVEANAERAAGQMKEAGMTATVRADQSNGKTYWRVIVGPAASVAERDALVARVKGIGYPDAYPVSN
jgi:cell division septation protein DedD